MVYLRLTSRGGNATQHSPEHYFVDGSQKMPVQDPEQTARLEENVLVSGKGPVVFTRMEHMEEAMKR